MEKINIKELIQLLEKEVEKGGKTVLFEGTLLVPETGNSVILTTEKQW